MKMEKKPKMTPSEETDKAETAAQLNPPKEETMESEKKQLAEPVADHPTAKDMEALVGRVEDWVIEEICAQWGLPLPRAITAKQKKKKEASLQRKQEEKASAAQKKGGSALGALVGALLIGSAAGGLFSSGTSGSRRCSGNCSTCPPHYGYRYGRWYYGHNHSEGCEFGGNCGGWLD